MQSLSSIRMSLLIRSTGIAGEIEWRQYSIRSPVGVIIGFTISHFSSSLTYTPLSPFPSCSPRLHPTGSFDSQCGDGYTAYMAYAAKRRSGPHDCTHTPRCPSQLHLEVRLFWNDTLSSLAHVDSSGGGSMSPFGLGNVGSACLPRTSFSIGYTTPVDI